VWVLFPAFADDLCDLAPAVVGHDLGGVEEHDGGVVYEVALDELAVPSGEDDLVVSF